MTLRLRKFNMVAMQPSSVIIMIGMQNTGKTFLIKDILLNNQDISSGTIICGSPYSKYTEPRASIYDRFDYQILTDVVKNQRRNTSKYFLVLDDCIYDQSWHNDPGVRNLFMHSRTLQTMFIFTQTYTYGIPPTLQACVDYVFIFRSSILANRRRLFDVYGSHFPNFDIFQQVLDACTQNEYDCMVLDFTMRSSRLEDHVFWYRSPSPPRHLRSHPH
jgi:hypothetical protein